MSSSVPLLLTILILVACNQVQDDGALLTMGNGAAPDARIATPAPEVPTTMNSELFNQGFELRSNMFVNFQGCSFTPLGIPLEYGVPCLVNIDITPPAVFASCPYTSSGSDYFPDNNLCEDTSDDLSCSAEAVIRENGMMTLSNAQGTGYGCQSFNGDFYYEVTECGETPGQRLWKCGDPETPRDLIWQQY